MNAHKTVFYELTQSFERIQKELLRNFGDISEISLTKRQEAVMHLMYQDYKPTVTELAEHFDITKSAVSQTITKLEEADLLTRSVNEENRREVYLELGERGLMLQQEFRKIEETVVEKYFSELPVEELSQVRDTLYKLERVINEKNSE
ncbi:MarR family transcriptional regulator [Salsuginibacillus halophilus]|uniref:MarR family transcriptional regulator n=1 Tax=Salsuginibacillus halophilus TaxID=517424 RepID=A0A2P8H849_9BACI|nr:MarR family transcriptional regulator [Salsuginibacillus halophilus]PSL42407.1 MarR family transcriptional regulator [Salsuginibacillus halophilus]